METDILEIASHRIERLAWTLTSPWNQDLIISDSLFYIFSWYRGKSHETIHKDSEKYNEIRSFISKCQHYCVLNHGFKKHIIQDGDFSQELLPPLIILYDCIPVDEQIEEVVKNTILDFTNVNYRYIAKLIVGDLYFTKGQQKLFRPKSNFPKELQIFDKEKIKHQWNGRMYKKIYSINPFDSLKGVSFLILSMCFSKNINSPFVENNIILTEDDRFILLDSQELLDYNTTGYNDSYLPLKDSKFFNNTIVLNGELNIRHYLSESDYGGSLWFDLNNFSILSIQRNESHYNGK